MNEIEKLIHYFNGYGSPFDDLIIQLAKEKQRRDSMRCENCKHDDEDFYGCVDCAIISDNYFEPKEGGE